MTHKEIIVTYWPKFDTPENPACKKKQKNPTKKTNIQAPTLCYAQSRETGEQHKSLKKCLHFGPQSQKLKSPFTDRGDVD